MLLALSISAVYVIWTISVVVPLLRPRVRAERSVRLHGLWEAGTIRRVLVATGGGPQAQLGLRLAADIVDGGDVELTLFSVLQPSEKPGAAVEEHKLRDWAVQILGSDLQVRTQVTTSSSVVDAILKETQRSQYDLLVLGASDERTVRGAAWHHSRRRHCPDVVFGVDRSRGHHMASKRKITFRSVN